MDIQINWVAVLLAAVASMVIGSIWYAKGAFGGVWLKQLKGNQQKVKAEVMKPLALQIILAFVLSLLMAFVLAHLAFIAHAFFRHSFLVDSVSTAFWVWLGVAFTRTVTHDAFEQQPLALTAINTANMLATMLAMGLIIGLLEP